MDLGCKVLICSFALAAFEYASATEIQTAPNTAATLPCNVTFPQFIKDINASLVEAIWEKNGSKIASFVDSVSEIDDSFSWDVADFIKGDFSLSVMKSSLILQGEYECTVSYNSTQLHAQNVTLSVVASPTVDIPLQWVTLERESHLKCSVLDYYPPPVSLSWTKDGQEIQPLQQIEGEETAEGFYRAEGNLTFWPSRDDQNVTFGCRVLHSGVEILREVQLNVTYVPTIKMSAVPSSSSSHPLTLYCDIESFYPEEMSVSWLQNGTILPNPPKTDQNPDGTYSTRQYYTLSPTQRQQGGEVACSVDQPGVQRGERALENLEELDPQEDAPVLTKSAKASVALMVISLVLVFLLCFGFSWRRRDEKQKSLNISGIILPPRVIVGQKGRVTISIEGRRVEQVKTAWFLNNTPIFDTSVTAPEKTNFNCLYNPLTTIHLPYGLTLTSPASEKGPLLPSRAEMGYYKLHTQAPLHSSKSGTQQLISALTFVPQISLHKGAVFKCQVSYMGKDKIVEERVSEKFTILSAPDVSEIQLSETPKDPDVISLTVRASHFHPDVITFRWFCQGGELSPVASQASSSPRPNSEGFFSAYSQCKLPRSELEKGGTKVWVSVHHIALKQPVTRETRGFIKRPQVSELISTINPDQSVTLGCELSDFYPPNVSVVWLKVMEGLKDDREEEPVKGGELFGPLQTQAHLYKATASLRRASGQDKQQREAGILCRVQHCSLPEPIERLWRHVDTGAPYIPPSISVCWSSEGVGVFSLLLKGGHPKAKLVWAAGGAILSPLVSSETEDIGDNGQREMKSVCALERSSSPLGPPEKGKRRDGRATKTRAAVTDAHTEGIRFIDEKVDGENNNMSLEEDSRSDVDEDSDAEPQDPGALHINRVSVSQRGSADRERLRVCVQITHPALELPVHRSWTEPNEEMSSSM